MDGYKGDLTRAVLLRQSKVKVHSSDRSGQAQEGAGA
jgi:hypothetical protein